MFCLFPVFCGQLLLHLCRAEREGNEEENLFHPVSMTAAKILAAAILLVLVVLGARADVGVDGDVWGSAVEQLRSKISALESSISEKTRELKSKDDSIAQLEKLIQEKSVSVASLEKEIESLQKKVALDVAEMVGKSNARASKLEAQVARLEEEIEIQTSEKDVSEARAREAEKKAGVLNLKLERLQKTVDEQKHRIQKTEHALEVAEEELMRAQLEATSKSKELTKVHGAWLPPWFATHIDHFQDLTVTCWNERLKPAVDIFLQKEAKKITKPYINKVTSITKPHVEKVQKTLRPYTKHATRTYRKFLRSSRGYHRWVQVKVQEKLKKHELTRPLATKEFVWLSASALFVAPIFFLHRVLLSVFCKKARKRPHIAHGSHSHRRHKRRHTEK